VRRTDFLKTSILLARRRYLLEISPPEITPSGEISPPETPPPRDIPSGDYPRWIESTEGVSASFQIFSRDDLRGGGDISRIQTSGGELG